MMSTETRRALHIQAPEGTWLGDWMHDFHTHLAAAGVAPVHMTRAKYAEVYGTDALAALDAFHTRTAEKTAAVEAHTKRAQDALARLRADDYGALADYREAEAALDAEQYMPTPARRESPADVAGVFQTHRGIEIDAPGGRWAMDPADALELASVMVAVTSVTFLNAGPHARVVAMEAPYGTVRRIDDGLEIETPYGEWVMQDIDALTLAHILLRSVHHIVFEAA